MIFRNMQQQNKRRDDYVRFKINRESMRITSDHSIGGSFGNRQSMCLNL